MSFKIQLPTPCNISKAYWTSDSIFSFACRLKYLQFTSTLQTALNSHSTYFLSLFVDCETYKNETLYSLVLSVCYTLRNTEKLAIVYYYTYISQLKTTSSNYIRKNLPSCNKFVNKPSTSCLRTACRKLSTSLEQAVNNL